MHILDLNDDVQWRILLMNADMDAIVDHGVLYEPDKGSSHFRYSPLTVTRRASQVCRLWRNFLFNSPSIWGRVFHLDFLNQENADWRNELLRRTGQSPLCIKGEVVGFVMEDFFFAVLNQEWSRIRRISVRIHNEWEFEDDTWEPLTRPTSILESFDLNLSGDESFPSKYRTRLFGNNAPLLAEFYPNNIKFSLQAPWVFQLRCIEISKPFTVQEILEALQKMTSLDTIILGRGVRMAHPALDGLPQVFLPGLGNIVLTCLLETALQFLEHVTPKIGCGLVLTTTDTFPLSEQDLEVSRRVLTQYSDNYFELYRPKRLLLNITQRFFYLHDLLDPIRPASSPTLKITIDTGSDSAKPLLFKVLTSLSTSSTGGLTMLDLLLDSNSVDPSDADFIRVMYSFTSLEVLQISSLDTLAQLQQLPRFKSILFPNLDVLFPNLCVLKVVHSTKISTDLLRSFLIWRQNIGARIRLLDLTFSSTGVFGNMSLLEEFDMKVVWSGHQTIEEYICGSGYPSRLNFTVH